MENVSGTGVKAFLQASHTFPVGIWLSIFADDKDAVSSDTVNINDTAMGVNGDMVFWGTPNVVPVKFGVIDGSEDDKNLSLLLENNRVAKNKASVKDIITLTIMYPDGRKKLCVNGVIKDGAVLSSVTSNARRPSREYTFHFENVI